MLKTILLDPDPQRLIENGALLESLRYDLHITLMCLDNRYTQAELQVLAPQVVFVFVDRIGHALTLSLLDRLKPYTFDLILLADTEHMAGKAFEYGATDFVSAPFSKDRLAESIEKVRRNQQRRFAAHDLEMLLNSIKISIQKLPNIPIPTMQGYEFLPVSDIVYAEADGSYTYIYLKDGKKITVSRTLKDFEQMLVGHAVVRTHQSFLVHIPYIQQLVKGHAPHLIMRTGHKIDISRAMKNKVLQVLLGLDIKEGSG